MRKDHGRWTVDDERPKTRTGEAMICESGIANGEPPAGEDGGHPGEHDGGQRQERPTTEITDFLEARLQPRGVAVVLEAACSRSNPCRSAS